MLLHVAIWLLVASLLAVTPLVPGPSRVGYATYGLAFVGFFLLTVTFVCGPRARATRSPFWERLLLHQRALGVYSFLVIAAHIACKWHFHYHWSLAKATGGLFQWVAFAALHLSFLILFAMFLTSNDLSVRLLGPWWKRIHSLGLLAYALTAVGVLAASLKYDFLRPFFPVFLLLSVSVLLARLAERRADGRG